MRCTYAIEKAFTGFEEVSIMRYKKGIWKLVVGTLLLFLGTHPVQAQVVENEVLRVTLEQTPDQYSMLYVTDLINHPSTAPIIFQIRMEPKVSNPEISIEVKFTADVPDLGLDNEEIFWVRSNPFELKGRLVMSNRDLAEQSNVVQTTNGPVTINAE